MGHLVERTPRRLRIPEELGIVGFLLGLFGAAFVLCLAMCSLS